MMTHPQPADKTTHRHHEEAAQRYLSHKKDYEEAFAAFSEHPSPLNFTTLECCELALRNAQVERFRAQLLLGDGIFKHVKISRFFVFFFVQGINRHNFSSRPHPTEHHLIPAVMTVEERFCHDRLGHQRY